MNLHYADEIMPIEDLQRCFLDSKKTYNQYANKKTAPNEKEREIMPYVYAYLRKYYKDVVITGDSFTNYIGVDMICDGLNIDLKTCTRQCDGDEILIDVYSHYAPTDSYIPTYKLKDTDIFLFANKTYYIRLARDAWKQIIDTKPKTFIMAGDKTKKAKKAIINLSNYNVRYTKEFRSVNDAFIKKDIWRDWIHCSASK